MNTKAVRQIVEMMKQADLTEFEIEEENFRLRIARGSSTAPVPQYIQAAAPASAPVAGPASAAPAPAAPKAQEGPVIKSPMVGTFYSTPSPDSPSFVSVGSKVSANTVVCIIEAMKVMNEIQAEQSGTIAEMLVENGQSVEYGQPLFRLTPA